MIKNLLALACLYASAASATTVVPLNVAEGVSVYNCAETLTKIDHLGKPMLAKSTGEVQVVDYGDSFFVLSTGANAIAFSGPLGRGTDNDYRTAQPVRGITMGKGYGGSTGTFIYIGTSVMMSWDCRR